MAWKPEYAERANARRRAEYAADPAYRMRRQAQRTTDDGARDKTRPHGSMSQWRRNNPERARALRITDKSRRRGAAIDPDHAEIILADPCTYCGAVADTVDHIVAIILGGDGEWENITAACRSCNASKGAKPLLLFLLSN